MTHGQRRLLVAAGAAIALLAVAAVVLVTVVFRSWRSVRPQLQGDVTVALGDDETMVFVAIAPGHLDVPGRLGGLFRGYELEICEPYLIGATEVTEGQWAAVMGEDLPWKHNPQRPKWLAFADAERFVARLNRIVGPEFEAWEYCAGLVFLTPRQEPPPALRPSAMRLASTPGCVSEPG